MINPLSLLIGKKKKEKQLKSLQRLQEVGAYSAVFTGFGNDMYSSAIVRACVRCLASQTSKATPASTSKRIERMLNRPNAYMNGSAFLYKIRTIYELQNTAFILIARDDMDRASGFYPIPYDTYEGMIDSADNIYIKFRTMRGEFVAAWEDIAVIRKDYYKHDIAGEDNNPILDTLELIRTSNEGIANAVKSTANLRGILKSTKSMLDPKDLKAMRDQFIDDYMDVSNNGGIAALDATEEYQPLNVTPTITNWTTMKEFRENCFRYFGVNDDILTANASTDKMQTFYEMQIEPFLIDLSAELTQKVFSERAQGYGNEIVYQSSTLQFMSMTDKLALKDYIDRGAITPNTWCRIVGLPEVEGGDEPIRRLDTAPVDQVAKAIEGKSDG